MVAYPSSRSRVYCLMARFRCLTCQGIYQNPQPDGSRYYHVCPPQRYDFPSGPRRPDDIPDIPVPFDFPRDERLDFSDQSRPGQIRAVGRGHVEE